MDGAGWDPGLFELVARWRAGTPGLHALMVWVTEAGWWVLAVAVLGAPFVARTRVARVRAWVAIPVVVVVWAVADVLKGVFAQPRPCRAFPDLGALECGPVGDYAFPSGHTTLVVALATALWLSRPRRDAIAATVVAALVAASRVYLGAHYVHDVVAAAVLGVVLTVVLVRGGEHAWTRLTARIGGPASTSPAPGLPTDLGGEQQPADDAARAGTDQAGAGEGIEGVELDPDTGVPRFTDPALFTLRLNQLFEQVRPPGGAPYTPAQVCARLAEHGIDYPAERISQLCQFQGPPPSLDEARALSWFFHVPVTHFTGQTETELQNKRIELACAMHTNGIQFMCPNPTSELPLGVLTALIAVAGQTHGSEASRSNATDTIASLTEFLSGGQGAGEGPLG